MVRANGTAKATMTMGTVHHRLRRKV